MNKNRLKILKILEIGIYYLMSWSELLFNLFMLDIPEMIREANRVFPRYPSSSSTFSPGQSFSRSSQSKMVISFFRPQGYPPVIQTIQPVWIATATSYLIPGPWNLWLYHFLSHGLGWQMRKSVPSTLTRHWLPRSSMNRSSHRIYSGWGKKINKIKINN